MADLIDRQAALDCFHDWIDKRGDVHTADEIVEYGRIEALPAIEQLCGYSIEYLVFIAKLMEGANVTPEAMASIIKDVGKVAKMVIEVARKQVEEAIVKTIMDGYEGKE